MGRKRSFYEEFLEKMTNEVKDKSIQELQERKNVNQKSVQNVQKIQEKVHEKIQDKVQEQVLEVNGSKILLEELSDFLSYKHKRRVKNRIYQTFSMMPETAELLERLHYALNKTQKISKTDLIDFALQKVLSELERELERNH